MAEDNGTSGFDEADPLRQLETGMSERAITALAASTRSLVLKPGEYLVRQGEPCDALYFVVGGALEVVSHGLTGREVVYGVLDRGRPIGELTIVDGSRRTASIRAISPAEVLAVSRPSFLDIAGRIPDIGLWLAQACAETARNIHLRADDSSFSSVEPRLATLLLSLTPPAPVNGAVVKATQQSLADRLGASREWVNKQLNEWANLGIVEPGRGRVTVMDPGALAAAAHA